MTQWRPDPARLRRPAYLSLADQFARAIADGLLPSGTKLRPHRDLAYELGLSVQTVSRAYNDLIRRGLIAGKVGSGSFVLPPAGDSNPPYIADRSSEVIDLSILKPVSDDHHIALMRDGLHWVADNLSASSALSFRPSSVLPHHRHVAAGWLKRSGIEVAPDNIVITDGATSAITTAVMSAVPCGATLAAPALTHHLLMPLCKYLGLHLEGLACDSDGILPDSLDIAAEKGLVRAVYTQPTAINPRANVTSLARRRDIVDIARRHDLFIVENDILGDVVVGAPTPYAMLAPERVFHIRGFTKVALPGLRLAYLSAPERAAAVAANRHLVTSWMATPLMVELLSHWIEDGTLPGLVAWQREALQRRHALAQAILAGLDFSAHPQGLHVWLNLPEGVDEDQFVAQARVHGVAIASGQAFRVNDHQRRNAVRIALGTKREDDLQRGLGLVRDLLRSSPEPLLPLL